MEQLQEAESETRALRLMTQRMILTQEEMVCFFYAEVDFLLDGFSLMYIIASIC